MMCNRMSLVVLFACISLVVSDLARGNVAAPYRPRRVSKPKAQEIRVDVPDAQETQGDAPNAPTPQGDTPNVQKTQVDTPKAQKPQVDIPNADNIRVDILPNHGPIPNGPEPAGLTTEGTIAAGIALSLGAISLIFLIRNRRQKP
ncbi:MAG: hypothetical protein JWN70_3459 [Planctomycetaceae bacterium]|nr:hypothetical protein [Planctomycetaceae bacterium]